MSIGTFPARADAEAALAKAITEQGHGGWVSPVTSRTTLAEYATGWLRTRTTANGTPLRPRVRELYESELRLHILPVLGTVELGRMKPATIRTWYSQLLAAGLGASTAAKCYRLLRAILNTAHYTVVIPDLDVDRFCSLPRRLFVNPYHEE